MEQLKPFQTAVSDEQAIALLALETRLRQENQERIRDGIRLRAEEAEADVKAAVQLKELNKQRMEEQALAAARALLVEEVTEPEAIARARELSEIESQRHEDAMRAGADRDFIEKLFTGELERQEKLQIAAIALRESVATLDERRAAELERAKQLFDEMVISAETYERALDEINKRYDEMSGKTKEALVALDRFALSMKQVALAGQAAFSDFLFDPFKDGLKGMVEGFANAMRRMIADALAAQIIGAIVRSFTTGGFSGGGFVGAGSGVEVRVGAAHGGLILGRGTGTSDSNLIRVSDGEYVVREAAVQKFGAGFFEKLNNLKVPNFDLTPRFAAGGLVGGAGTLAFAGGGVTINNTNNIDARGATPGMEHKIGRVMREVEDRAVARSVRTVADMKRRGGAFSSVFKR